jgi:hypothetical protein
MMRLKIIVAFLCLMIFPFLSMSEELDDELKTPDKTEESTSDENANEEDKKIESDKRLRIQQPDLKIKGGSLELDLSSKFPKHSAKISPEGWGLWFGPDVMVFYPDLSERLEPMTEKLEVDDFDDSLTMMGLRMQMTFGHSLAMGAYYNGGFGMEEDIVEGEKHQASINMSMAGLSGQIQYPVMSKGKWEDLTGRLELYDTDIVPSYPPRMLLGTRFGVGKITLTTIGDDLFEDTERGTEFFTQIAPYAGMMIPLHKWVRAETYVGYNYIEFSTGTADFEMDDEKMISGKDFSGPFAGVTLSYGAHFEGKEKSSEPK